MFSGNFCHEVLADYVDEIANYANFKQIHIVLVFAYSFFFFTEHTKTVREVAHIDHTPLILQHLTLNQNQILSFMMTLFHYTRT